MTTLPSPGPQDPEPLSVREKKILAQIEGALESADPGLVDLSTTVGRAQRPPAWRTDRVLQAVAVLVIAVTILPGQWVLVLIIVAVLAGPPLTLILTALSYADTHHRTSERIPAILLRTDEHQDRAAAGSRPRPLQWHAGHPGSPRRFRCTIQPRSIRAITATTARSIASHMLDRHRESPGPSRPLAFQVGQVRRGCTEEDGEPEEKKEQVRRVEPRRARVDKSRTQDEPLPSPSHAAD